MIALSTKIKDRLTKGVKKFKPILLKAKTADINESDTVTIIVDILCDVFGYDKYEQITSEFAIKKTFCDLAVKLDDKVKLLLECKAIGLDLKDDFVRQATNYAADAGIDWVVLTNGIQWQIFKVTFTKPVDKELVYSFDFCEIDPKKQSDLELLYYLSIEAFSNSSKNTLDDLHSQKKILNKYIIGQVLITDACTDNLRKHLKKICPDIKVTNDELIQIISSEIFKREIVEGDSAADARKRVQKLEKALSTAKATKASE